MLTGTKLPKGEAQVTEAEKGRVGHLSPEVV